MADPGFSLLVQPHGPFGSYREGTATSVDGALALLEAAKYATFTEGGEEKAVHADDDRLSILGPDGMELKAWSRLKGDIGPDLTSGDRPPVIGWQIVDREGVNIHGELADPFDLATFEILTDEAVATAIGWAARTGEFTVVPVREGDIENPALIGVVSERYQAAVP